MMFRFIDNTFNILQQSPRNTTCSDSIMEDHVRFCLEQAVQSTSRTSHVAGSFASLDLHAQ